MVTFGITKAAFGNGLDDFRGRRRQGRDGRVGSGATKDAIQSEQQGASAQIARLTLPY